MPSIDSADQLLSERMETDDPYFNYCYWPYDPRTDGIGKLRPSTLLFCAVSHMPESRWLTKTLRTIQQAVGGFRSVYGIKQVEQQWQLEVYLYDYERQARWLSIERLVTACNGRISLPTTVGSHLPYFMFSFDLTENVAAANGQIDDVHVYIGNPGSSVSSGISYRFSNDPTTTELENFYFFFAANDRQNIVDKVCCAAFIDASQQEIRGILPEELMDCHTICLANKRRSNTVYFSGIHVGQLQWFLQWQSYPQHFQDFVTTNFHQLDHLRFDVGVDYCMVNDRLQILKSGIYGVF